MPNSSHWLYLDPYSLISSLLVLLLPQVVNYSLKPFSPILIYRLTLYPCLMLGFLLLWGVPGGRLSELPSLAFLWSEALLSGLYSNTGSGHRGSTLPSSILSAGGCVHQRFEHRGSWAVLSSLPLYVVGLSGKVNKPLYQTYSCDPKNPFYCYFTDILGLRERRVWKNHKSNSNLPQ